MLPSSVIYWRFKTTGTKFHTLHFISDNVKLTLQFKNYFWLCWKQRKMYCYCALSEYTSPLKILAFWLPLSRIFQKPYLGLVGRDILWTHKQYNSIPSLGDPLWLATVCWLTVGNTTCLLVEQLTAVQIPSET